MARKKIQTDTELHPPPPRRRRWRIVLAAVFVLVAIVVCAPMLVSQFFLAQLMQRASQQVNGQLVAKSARFGWLSTIELDGLEGRDPQGKQVFAIEHLRLDKSLLNLVMDPSALGTLQIDSLHIHVVTRKGGSNLEDFLQPLLSMPRKERPLDVAWNIQNARIEFRSQSPSDSAPEAIIEAPLLQGKLQRAVQQNIEAKGELTIIAQNRQGRMHLDAQANGLSSNQQIALRNATGKLAAKLENVPLLAFAPIIRRFTDQLSADGILNGAVAGQIDKGQAHIRWTDLGTEQNEFFIAALSNDKPVRIEQIKSSGQLHWEGDQVHVDTSLASDFGTASFKIASIAPADGTAVLSALSAANLSVSARLDLPRLAQALPDRMGLRDDVSITSGSIELDLRGEPRDTETVWTASLVTSDLAGTRGATSLVWDDPIRAKMAARWSRGRLAIDDLECRSEFLTANLKGNADDAEVRLVGDLQKLADRMQQFFELPADFAGKLDGLVTYERRPPEILISSQLTTTDFIWIASEHSQLHEPRLVFSADATLRQDQQQQLESIDAASAQLVAGDDMFSADLKAPIKLRDSTKTAPLRIQLRGNLAQWKSRLQPFVNLESFSLGGLCDATGDVQIGGQVASIDRLDGEIHDFAVTGEGIQIKEPLVKVDIAGVWDGEKKKWTTKRGEFATSALAASGDDIELILGEVPSITGKLAMRADLSRLQEWFPSRTQPQQRLRLTGEFIGDAFLHHESVTMLVQIDGGVEGFELSQPVAARPGTTVANPAEQFRPLWNEKEARITATARWRQGGNLDIHTARLDGEGWTILTDGRITGLPSAPILDLEGSANYDWQTLAPRLRFTAGETFLISGTRQDPLAVKGPLQSGSTGLVSPELVATGAIGWDAANFQGVVIGPGEMTAELKQSIVQFSLLEIPISEGMLSIAPRIDLRQAPARLEIPPGTVLKDIRITPTMCRTWLKYVVPVVADAAKAEGSFDLQLDQVSVPLGHPQLATLTGAIVLHEARVSASPLSEVLFRASDGLTSLSDRRLPRLGELASGSWVELPSQVIPFEMKDGRILHRDTQIKIKDVVTLQTRGSVGIDESVDLLVEFRIRDGKPWRVPLRFASLDEIDIPRVAADILRANAGNVLRDNAGDAVEGLLRDGLKRIFQDP